MDGHDESAHNAQNPGEHKTGRNSPPLHTRWKPGQSGNPGGRPKGRSLLARVRNILEREHGGKELMDLLAERFVKEALAGKFPFAKELIDRLEGTLNQRHDVNQCQDVRIIVSDGRGTERVGSFDDIRAAALGQPSPTLQSDYMRVTVEDGQGNERPGSGADIINLMAPPDEPNADGLYPGERVVSGLRELYEKYPAPLPPGYKPPEGPGWER